MLDIFESRHICYLHELVLNFASFSATRVPRRESERERANCILRTCLKGPLWLTYKPSVFFLLFFFVKTLWTIFIFFKIPFCLISNCKCFHICTKFNFIFIALLWKHQSTRGWQYGQYVTKSRTASSKAPHAVRLTAETSFRRLCHVMLGNFSVAKHLL